jgi:hypothetical protein
MEKVKCPFCGLTTDEVVCPRCKAEIPRDEKNEEPAEQTTAKKSRKTK